MKSLLGALLEGRLVELPSADKETSLKYLAHLIEAVPDWTPKIDLAEAILRQERLTPSGIGSGVACPHVWTTDHGTMLCSVGWSPEGIEYGASDGKKVHLVVMYLIPEVEKHNYLKEISSLAGALERAGDIQSIARAEDITSVREHLLGWLTTALEAEVPRTKTRMIQLQARQKAAEVAWAAPPPAETLGPRRSLDQKIDELLGKIGQLGKLVASLVSMTEKLVAEGGPAPLDEMARVGLEIELLEDQIDSYTLSLIALHHPLGSDIRLLYVVPKIVSDLGRIGGQTMRLAGKVPKFRSQASEDLRGRLKSDLARSGAVFRQCLEALGSRSATLAQQLSTREGLVESSSTDFFGAIITFLKCQSAPSPEAFSWSLIPHHLERIAHYSRTIGEDLLFWLLGAKTRHRHDDISEIPAAAAAAAAGDRPRG